MSPTPFIVQRPRRTAAVATFFLAACGAGFGAAPAVDPEVKELPEQRVSPDDAPSALARFGRWSDARLRGIFETILPDTQERRTWRLTLQPHFRDFVRDDHVRLPVGLIYGFDADTEGELELDTYFPNPAKDGSRTGIANIRTNFKRRWTPWTDASVSAATGLEIVRPIPSSPAELNDGVNRYKLYLTFARPSPTITNLEGYLNLSYDLITPSAAQGTIDEDEPQDDFYRIATGVLYRRREATYGVEVSWARTVDGEITNFVTVTPSIVYDIPRRYTFRSPGVWQAGAALETKRWGDHTDVSVRFRVRWLIDVRRAIRNLRNGGNAASAP